MRIAVCDVGLGNLRSVERALLEAGEGLDLQVEVTSDPARIAAADRLVMPGQGGFGDCARALSSTLGDAVREHLRAGRPYLGICLGLQILFASSEEAPGVAGLGFLPGRVVRLKGGIDPSTDAPLKIPHIGWNTADPRPGHEGLLPAGLARHFYFVHSFVVVPRGSRHRRRHDRVRRAVRQRRVDRPRLRVPVPPREERPRRSCAAREVPSRMRGP